MNKIKKLLLAVFLLVVSFNSFGEVIRNQLYAYPITRVIDGDTVEFQATFLPPPLKPVLALRVYGVDTPEGKPLAKCFDEYQKATFAKEFTKLWISMAYQEGKTVLIEIISHDKYGGRVLGDVVIDGERLSQALIAQGHAKPYKGGKKSSWCS